MHIILALGLLFPGAILVNGGSNMDSTKVTRLLTYNVGLAPSVPDYGKRTEKVPGALGKAAENVDFMCIQELWYEKDMVRVIDAVKNELPYHYSVLHYRPGQLKKSGFLSVIGDAYAAPCDAIKALQLKTCLKSKCVRASDMRKCLVTNCTERLFAMSDECLSCLTISYQESESRCVNLNPFASNVRFNPPGLFIASRKKLTAQYVNYHAGHTALLQRGYIKAQIENLPPVVCTHLTAVINGPKYEVKLPYADYNEEQKAEIRILHETFNGTRHVLIGDMNTGPEETGLGDKRLFGEVPKNYEMLISSAGYTNPYLEEDGRCTYCDNNLVQRSQNMSYGNMALDHILLKDLEAQTNSTKRLFDKSEDGALSDHYGVGLAVRSP